MSALVALAFADGACRAPPEPKAAPGLWLQTVQSVSQRVSPPRDMPPRASLICVDGSGKIDLPYYRVKAGPDCSVDRHDRTFGGAWTSKTVCHNPGFGDMTITATVTGDFAQTYQIKGRLRSSSADILAAVTGVFQGPCPTRTPKP